jgi:hypothetical protein
MLVSEKGYTMLVGIGDSGFILYFFRLTWRKFIHRQEEHAFLFIEQRSTKHKAQELPNDSLFNLTSTIHN